MTTTNAHSPIDVPADWRLEDRAGLGFVGALLLMPEMRAEAVSP